MLSVRLTGRSIVENIDISYVRPATRKLRHTTGDLSSLMASISEKGLIEPIIVRPRDNGFEIVCGHRRFEACKKLGLKEVTCLITNFTDQKAFEASLIENLQRESLDPIEEANAYKKYVTEYGWGSITKLAKKIGKSEEYVSHRLLLLNLPSEVLDDIVNRSMSPSKARELVWLKNAELQREIAESVKVHNLSAKTIHDVVKLVKAGFKVSEAVDAVSSSNIQSARLRDEEPNRDSILLERSIAVLRIAMMRMDSVIEEAKSEHVRKHMIKQRYSIHQMIDDSMRRRVELFT